MALFVIARLLDEKGRSLAYKVYSNTTKKSMLIHKRDVADEIINKNVRVIGLEPKTIVVNDKCSTKIKELRNLYKTTETDEVDCIGNLITDKPKYIVLGVYGFGANRVFKCVDGNAVEHMIPYDEFYELLKEKRIIGATINKGAIHIYKDCNKQLYEKI